MTPLADFGTALLRLLPPEAAHAATLRLVASGMVPPIRGTANPTLEQTLWGRQFPNPVGLAAGFDKNAEVPEAMLRLGFGFVECGSVTPRPQEGNPRPRLFRLPADRAIINRMGFNNAGLDAFEANLRRQRLPAGAVVGVNLGKNKDTADAAADYVTGVRRLAPMAGYLVVNVSSPNTPGLRALQGREPLEELLRAVLAARAETVPDNPPPLLVKVAPDLLPDDRADVAAVALDLGIDGLIVSNTTISRPSGLSGPVQEAGGLSGRPLFPLATDVLRDFRRLTGGRLVLVGAGGVASGRDAYAKIRAGASLVQLYTALVYEGPGLVGRICRELATCLRRDGFANVAEAVGADVTP